MGNTTTCETKFLPGDDVIIQSNGKQFVVESVNGTNVILEGDPNVYSDNMLTLVVNEESKRRRRQYKLLQDYVRACVGYNVKPLNIILDIFSEYIKQGRNVTTLDLHGQHLGDNDAQAISHLLKNGSALRSLDLHNNRIGPKGAASIFSCLYSNTTLQKLDMSYNPITISGIDSLCYALQYNKTLNDLKLAKTKISAEGSHAIIDALLKNPNSGIYRLDLTQNEVGDEHMEKLLNLATQNRCLCFVELYPSKDKDSLTQENQDKHLSFRFNESSTNPEFLEIQKKKKDLVDDGELDGWLSYNGWELYSQFRDALSKNLEFRKQNPHLFHARVRRPSENTSDILNFIMYNLGAVKDETIAQLFDDPSGRHDLTKQSKEERRKLMNFETWKKNKELRNEWQRLAVEQSRLLQLEKKLRQRHSSVGKLDLKVALSDNLIMDKDGITIHDKNINDTKLEIAEEKQEGDWVVLDDEFSIAPTPIIEDKKIQIILEDDQTFERSSIDFDIQRQELQKSLDPMIKCGICLEEKPSSDMYIIDECYDKFCLACLQQYVEHKVQTGQTDSISCPNCKRELSVQEIRQLTNKDLLDKFNEFSLKKAISKLPNICYCPNPLCGNAMIGDVNDSPMMICPNEKCKIHFCFNCKVPWHDGLTCDEYIKWKSSQQTQDAEKKFDEWRLVSNVKSCPDCKFVIQKNGGCNKMTCTNCGCSFCNVCGEKIETGHFLKGTCKQWM